MTQGMPQWSCLRTATLAERARRSREGAAPTSGQKKGWTADTTLLLFFSRAPERPPLSFSSHRPLRSNLVLRAVFTIYLFFLHFSQLALPLECAKPIELQFLPGDYGLQSGEDLRRRPSTGWENVLMQNTV